MFPQQRIPVKIVSKGKSKVKAASPVPQSVVASPPSLSKKSAQLPSQPMPQAPRVAKNFPIDLVYTWVDGNDEELIKLRENYMHTQPDVVPDSTSSARWRDLDELRHSIESALVFAPWIRRIFIVTDHQRPYWYDENYPSSFTDSKGITHRDRLTFVDHPDLFGEFDEHLPVFNSHAIECHLHRIPGLAEHFIYANDDCFFGAPCLPEDFFTVDGKFKAFVSKYELPGGAIAPDDVPYTAAQKNVRSLLAQTFGDRGQYRKLKHQMKPLCKTACEYCWGHELFSLYLFNTSSTRFRSVSDVDPINLVSQVAMLTGLAIPAEITSKYYVFVDKDDPKKVFKHLWKWRPTPKIYCLNDDMQHPSPVFIEMIRKGLDRYLPHLSNIV